MLTRPSARNNPSSSLSIRPPSSPSTHYQSVSSTPTNQSFSNFPSPLPSPRRPTLNPPASPTYSTHSNFSNTSVPWLASRSRAGSFDIPRDRPEIYTQGQGHGQTGPPVPPKNEKRQVPQGYNGPPSPHKGTFNVGRGSYAGAYDSKLVSILLARIAL